MTIFSDEEASSRLAAVPEKASTEGEVRIKRSDGQEFIVRPAPKTGRSPLDVGSVKLGLTAEEIVAIVRQGRERSYP